MYYFVNVINYYFILVVLNRNYLNYGLHLFGFVTKLLYEYIYSLLTMEGVFYWSREEYSTNLNVIRSEFLYFFIGHDKNKTF